MVFHDRRLQYMEHQQLEGWKWNRPGDRLLDIGESLLCDYISLLPSFCSIFFSFCFIRISVSKQHKASGEGVFTVRHVSVTDIPMSVGITEPHTHTSQLNAAEFLWDLSKRASVFVQVHKSTRKISPLPRI